jgi:hypothetical protein
MMRRLWPTKLKIFLKGWGYSLFLAVFWVVSYQGHPTVALDLANALH